MASGVEDAEEGADELRLDGRHLEDVLVERKDRTNVGLCFTENSGLLELFTKFATVLSRQSR